MNNLGGKREINFDIIKMMTGGKGLRIFNCLKAAGFNPDDYRTIDDIMELHVFSEIRMNRNKTYGLMHTGFLKYIRIPNPNSKSLYNGAYYVVHVDEFVKIENGSHENMDKIMRYLRGDLRLATKGRSGLKKA